MLRRIYSLRVTVRRGFGLTDLAVLLGTLGLLYLLARVGSGMLAGFHPPQELPKISADPSNLPYYAARTTLRMFLALGLSLLFTLIYSYAAARNRYAERILVPLLDMLQSVPVLGFLSVTVTGFIALFPGSLLGLEAASIFAIFTSQAWNMAFSFYQSLKTLPRDLDEATRLYRLSRWQRFTQLEVPASMIGLVWNAMMSFGGGWFFVAASEAISVLNHSYTLPGIGSYVAAAVAARNFAALGWALVTMVFVILIVDQLFWRPLVAWADKFKQEQSAAVESPRSWVLNLLRAAYLPKIVSSMLPSIEDAIGRLSRQKSAVVKPVYSLRLPGRSADMIFNGLLVTATAVLFAGALRFVLSEVHPVEVSTAALQGFATFGRVLVLLVLGTLVWTPIGVAIGFNPRLAHYAQPVVQFLASFPANFLFPFVTLLLLRTGTSLNWGSILLMSLGAQWYILFNTIAGAMSIPTDLREMAANMGVCGWHLWRALIIPGIFTAWVTGGITAAGGAWNASIVAEMVSWGSTTLTAYGLGSYISRVTQAGDWPRIVLGVGMMSIYVVGLNRLFWRKLYALAEARYRLD